MIGEDDEITVTEGLEEAIEREYAKGPGNMNLPDCPNIPGKFYREGIENNKSMTKEEERRLKTQCKLSVDTEEMSQLVDRIDSHSFQG